MRRTLKIKIVITFLIGLMFTNVQAQTFGFGCLGLSGFYAGMSQENYTASGVNDFLNVKLSSMQYSGSIKFERGTGYRIGANIVRAKFDKIFLTAKGYYQFLKEERSNSGTLNNAAVSSNYQLIMNHWGAGIDFGIKIFTFLDWKIVEGNVNFYDSEFIIQDFKSNILDKEAKYNSEKVQVGYFLGTGLIFHIVPDYISLEGTVGYSFFKFDKFKSTDALGVVTNVNNPLPEGGTGITLQINIGFPF
ncbi:MAG: hypothetical protein CVV24_06395 [Ignavibacteriae bacterium HGW-Ignavibacteriae-3]|nr:MAG: hypothetical protein CVV24_06395 [Ignavibacteriae bacterium HGW-Ignavibacteriae-3]